MTNSYYLRNALCDNYDYEIVDFLQETALFKEFTIAESFSYFGKIYGMNMREIDGQGTFLLNLLNLPNQDSRIGKLR